MASLITLTKRFFHVAPIVRYAVKVQGPSGWTGREHHGGYKRFKIIALINILVIGGLTYRQFAEEKERERPPFIKYEYMRIRTKRFPWGEGDKSMFHNPRVNALSDGYEDVSD